MLARATLTHTYTRYIAFSASILRSRREGKRVLQRSWSHISNPCAKQLHERGVFSRSFGEAQAAISTAHNTQRVTVDPFLALTHHVRADFVFVEAPAPKSF